MAADPYKYFRLEARELLDQFGESMLALEKGGDGALQVQRLLRLAHTLKGAARVVKQLEIADLAHAIEDDLAPFRDAAERLPVEQIRGILGRLDDIGQRLRLLNQAEAAPSPGAPTPAAPEELFRTVRADIAEMDALLQGVSETYALLSGLRRTASDLERGRRLADVLLEQFAQRRSRDEAVPRAAPPQRMRETVDELRKCFNRAERALSASLGQLDGELRLVRGLAEQLRLVPASALLTSLERTARDAAEALGKQVEFEGRGGDLRLDAYLLGTVQAALVQIVRNALAHGLETPQARLAAGKPAAGRLAIDIRQRGRDVVFQCRDDGRGLDLEAVRAAALRRGLPAAAADRLGAEELIGLLLRGGITTSAEVTAVSGRGVGLDVVREAAEKLGGVISCRTGPGTGAVFELVAPLSLAAVDCLLVEAAGMIASIPFDAVRRTMRLGGDEISRTASGATVVHDQAAIPFLALPTALSGSESSRARTWPMVVVAGTAGLAAIGVDRLLGAARIVMRPLPDLAFASPIVAGVSLDAGGDPQLVLDPDGLVSEARATRPGLEAPVASPLVLVIDDSLTTRMLEQSILESAGFEVDVATCAEEGLEQAHRRAYALFLVDVEMPGMDGFSFIERIRQDPMLSGTPAILVSSRNAPEDLQRGRDVGAQGYVVKSEFDQAELLAMIQRLLG
ncbi:MAG: response regulator [Caulobacteraceae bacterium]|nr:response regulator [Caulobacteraceae bacterium]